MLLYMSNDLVDGVQYGHVPILRPGPLREPFMRQGGDNSLCLGHRIGEMLVQFSRSQAALLIELCVANAYVCRSANTVNNPLPHIAAEMQYQIAHGILVSTMALPDLLVTQLVETRLKKAGHLI